MIRTTINNDVVMIKVGGWAVFRISGTGMRRIISISKTRKITARRKKRIEKGIRAVFFGSNPHSNGEDFSRSIEERVEII